MGTDRVICFLHIPLNFGAVMKRTVAKIEAAGAKSETMIVLSDDNSLWGSDVYLEVTKEVPGVSMSTISGTFLSKVFEGSFSQMGAWMDSMKAYTKTRGKEPRKIFCYYTTCPKCAKKYGKNYVVLLAQV